jgi:hypothetical protein
VTAPTTDVSPAGDAAPVDGRPRGQLPRLAIALPILVLVAAGVVVALAGRGTTFFYDEWIWIMQRRSPGAGSLLEPFNNHLMALPIATYEVLFRLFGLDTQAPYRIVLLLGHLATCGLVYVYLRARIGWVLALAGAAALAFFGYAWAVIIWPISLGWVYATTAGIAALLLVDRDTRRADAAATFALLIGIASSGIAVPFVLGLSVEMVLRRAWHRLYVPGAALVAFVVWYLSYGTGTNDHGSVGDIVEFAEKLLAQTVGTILGVDDRGTAAHVVFVIAGLGLLVSWFALGRPRSPRLVGNATALVAFTALLAYSRATSGLTTWHSYAAAVFLLLTVAELFRGREPSRLVIGAIGAVALWSIVWNLGQLSDGADLQRFRAEEMRAQLTAVDVAGSSMASDYKPGRFFLETHAGPYLDVAAEYGSPAYSFREAQTAPRHARRAADATLVQGTGARVRAHDPVAGCAAIPPTRTGITVVRQRHPSLLVSASDGPATISAGVFSTDGAVVGHVPSGRTGWVTAPALASGRPWTVRVRTDGSTTVCTTPPDL